MGNDNLYRALKNKNDEFYTYYEDIEKEMSLYKQYLAGKEYFYLRIMKVAFFGNILTIAILVFN